MSRQLAMFPIKDRVKYEFYNKYLAMLWVPSEVDLSNDSWEDLKKDEQTYLKSILAFFGTFDGLINENIDSNMFESVDYDEETKRVFRLQESVEDIHNFQYSLLIDTYIKDEQEKLNLLSNTPNIPSLMKKINWFKQKIQDSSDSSSLLYNLIVEAIFFSSSFAAIFWIKSTNRMAGLCQTNEFIAREEATHCDFAIYLLKKKLNELRETRIIEVFEEAVKLEEDFVKEIIPNKLVGISKEEMCQHVQFTADYWLDQLLGKKIYNVSCPFTFLTQIALSTKTNFFEGRPTQYSKANLTGGFSTESEF